MQPLISILVTTAIGQSGDICATLVIRDLKLRHKEGLVGMKEV